MEQLEIPNPIDQMRINGGYERRETDTAQLAEELACPQDLHRLTVDFDNGATNVRAAGEMSTAQRSAILTSFEDGNIDMMAISRMDLLFNPVAQLHQRITDMSQNSQFVGHNFFRNAKGMVDLNEPWGRQFDATIRANMGYSITEIDRFTDSHAKNQVLSMMTSSHEMQMIKSLAIYLAGRSLVGERYLNQEYGAVMDQAKAGAYKTTEALALETGLRIDMIERAAGQFYRTKFGSFDYLAGLVTAGDTGALGDYLIGTLRVEVQFKGTVRSPELPTQAEAYKVVAHELQHAGSAQAEGRCGLLSASSRGNSVNEGMTEYLAQLSMGSPGIEQLPGGHLSVQPGVSYRAPVFAMLSLHEQFKSRQNQHFATLFNAYHGDVRNSGQLEQALDEFYRKNIDISQQLYS